VTRAEILFKEVERTREAFLTLLTPEAKKRWSEAVDAWCAAAAAEMRRAMRGQRGAA
jgi:hypothetical protein